MKAIVLALASVFVAAQGFPNTREASKTLQKLDESKNNHFGTPEYDEVADKFKSTIGAVLSNVQGLRSEAHIRLERSETGKILHTDLDHIIDPYLSELMNSVLEVFNKLPSAGSIEEVATTSKAVWDKAIYNRGVVNYAIVDLVANVPDVVFDFNQLLRAYNIGFNDAVGSLFAVLKKYLPDN